MAVAARIGAEILSVDSMQVYRGMDIGTAKPSASDRVRVTHHMVDVADPADHFTVADFRAGARAAIAAATAETVLIVGGSGMHFRSVVDPMSFRPHDPTIRREIESAPLSSLIDELLAIDPHAGSRIDLANPRRVRRSVESWRVGGLRPSEWAATEEKSALHAYRAEIEFTGIGVDHPGLAQRVSERLSLMRRDGFLGEVERLAPLMGPTARQAVGYRQLLEVVEGGFPVEEGFLAAERATMRVVKRQRTYFRRDPRLTWIDASESGLADLVVELIG